MCTLRVGTLRLNIHACRLALAQATNPEDHGMPVPTVDSTMMMYTPIAISTPSSYVNRGMLGGLTSRLAVSKELLLH